VNNAELRIKALAKVKDKNFSVLSSVAYAIAAVSLLLGDITGILAIDALIMLAAGFLAGLVSAAGYAKVSMGIWMMNKGGFSELFSCYKSKEALKRGALPAGAYALMLTVLRLGVLSGVWYAAVISGLVCIALQIIAFWGGYVIAIEEKNCPVKAFVSGLKLAVNNIVRVIGMKLYLYWWIAAVIAAAAALCINYALPGAFTGLVVFLVGLVCRWMVGAFIALAEAGLAREAYRK